MIVTIFNKTVVLTALFCALSAPLGAEPQHFRVHGDYFFVQRLEKVECVANVSLGQPSPDLLKYYVLQVAPTSSAEACATMIKKAVPNATIIEVGDYDGNPSAGSYVLVEKIP